MRLVVLLLAVCAASAPAQASTVWNVTVETRDGGSAKLTFIDADPSVALPRCPCVAGAWRGTGETATHFVGTLDAPSFNHPRRAVKAISARVRKTRALMGVHRDYRAALHGILRGSGHVVLREVAGGEWEVSGYAHDAVGDLFADHTRWTAARRPPPAKPSPFIDANADATALAELINDYRAGLGLPRVPLSRALTKVARAHVRDLNVNKPAGGRCNMHSWSKHGSWTACCYDGSRDAARCMWRKPTELAGYRSPGYEIAANASGITPERALALWQDSAAHHAVMINKDQWKQPWRALGVAIEGDYAVAWFGERSDAK